MRMAAEEEGPVTPGGPSKALAVALDLAINGYARDLQLLGDGRIRPSALEQFPEFGSLPVCTWRLGEAWRLQFISALLALRDRIADGGSMHPVCVAQEIGLWGAIEIAEASDPTSCEWEDLREDLFQDTDFLLLFDPRSDGLASDPGAHSEMGFGNLEPHEWFEPFNNVAELLGNAG